MTVSQSAAHDLKAWCAEAPRRGAHSALGGPRVGGGTRSTLSVPPPPSAPTSESLGPSPRNAQAKKDRLKALEAQLRVDLLLTARRLPGGGAAQDKTPPSSPPPSVSAKRRTTLPRQAARFDHPAFTWAAIAGDQVILRSLADTGLLHRVPVVFIDTLHLFPETHEFLERMEKHFGFKAVRTRTPPAPRSGPGARRARNNPLHIIYKRCTPARPGRSCGTTRRRPRRRRSGTRCTPPTST